MRWGSPPGRANRMGQDRGQFQLQRRLLRLVTFLVLILVMMRHAADPANWNWFWALSPAHPTDSARPTSQTRLRVSETGENQTHWVPGLRPELLRAVRDDSHFRKDEHEVWFHLWDCLKRADSAQLKAASLGHLSYLQLYRQMAVYRGQLCDLRGTIRRAHRLPAPKNDAGIDEYWQCWLLPDESPTSPIVVYLLNVPTGFEEGMELDVPAEATVCSFKRWAYSRGDELLVAPVVMATDVSLTSQGLTPAMAARPDRGTRPTWPWIVGVAVAATLLAWGLTRLSRKVSRSGDRLPNKAPSELANLSTRLSASGKPRDDSHESL